jgi:sugar lactone lactonase YvrE
VRCDVAFAVGAELGEGALWDWRHGLLVSVDIPAGRVLLSDPRAGSTRAIEIGQPVGAAMLQGEDQLLLAVRDGFCSVDLATGARSELVPVEADDPTRRMNDAACDPGGRCFAGTMADAGSDPTGTLYRLDPDLSVHVVDSALKLPNGLGWSPAGDAMYHVDSRSFAVDVLDFDNQTGATSNRRRLVHTDPDWGLPDGMAVDAEGGIWVAFWDGAELRRFDAAGGLTEEVELPVDRPTRPAFGGGALDRLYVTTAKRDGRGGDILVLDPGVRGLPAPVFRPR